MSPATPSKRVPSGKTPDASIVLAASRSRQRPIASKFSIEKPIGSMRTWHTAQLGFARCLLIASRIDIAVPGSSPSILSAGMFAGGGGGAEESRFSSTHLPRTTGEVRVA